MNRVSEAGRQETGTFDAAEDHLDPARHQEMGGSAGTGRSAGRERLMMSSFDITAADFDRHRALPDRVVEMVRSAVLTAIAARSDGIALKSARRRLLDLGAGSGRIGWSFVAACDDYVGIDLSYRMLQAFRGRDDT